MSPEPISFARGAPSLDIVDVEGLRAAADRALSGDPAGAFSYGTAIGYPPLREWIAERHGVEPARVIVTNGSMQADAFLFEALVREGDSVVVESPTYDRTLLSLRSQGADVHAITLEEDGIDVAELATRLDGGLRPRLAHIIPNFQNPAGFTLARAKRDRLLELAGAHDFVVFEDDPYVALRFRGETLPTMLDLDGDRVVYASSFSKTVCPGIRVGYLVGPEDLLHYLKDAGLEPGVEGVVERASDGDVVVRSNGRDCTVTSSVAETVSATLAVTVQSPPLERTTTSPSLARSTTPSSPGSKPASLR